MKPTAGESVIKTNALPDISGISLTRLPGTAAALRKEDALMNVSLFPSHLRTHRITNLSRSKRDVQLAELLQSLRGMVISFDDIYHMRNLSLLSDVIAGMQLDLLQRPNIRSKASL